MTKLYALLLLLLVTAALPAQSLLERATDLLEFDLRRGQLDSGQFVPKVVVAPTVSYEPSTSIGLGLGAKLLFKPGRNDAVTRTSNLPIGLTYTLRNQFIFNSGYTVFFDRERWLLKGNLRYSKFPQRYYGVGNLTTEDNRIDIAFEQFLVEPLLLRQVLPDFFLGAGLRYNRFFRTELEKATEELPAGYDLQDSLGSTSTGLELAFTVDSRDNVLNARTGTLLEFTHGLYGRALGGTNDFMLTRLDLRKYYPVRPGSPNVWAFSVFGRYSWRRTPVQELSSLGGAELLRGFQEGRFRDRLAVFTQAEFRWQTWERVGFVFFGGAGQVAPDPNDLRVDDMRYSLGGGLRLKIIPSENLNLRIDYALGLGPSRDGNFYLGIAEAF